MSFKRFKTFVAVMCVLSAVAATCLAQSDSLSDGTTPLHWAVDRVDEELVETLLARGAKADVVNAYGSSPLAEAVRVANVNMLQPGRSGASSRFRDDLLNTGATPLLRAAQTFDNDVVRLFVDLPPPPR